MDNVERLIAIEEIKRLKSQYIRYMDTKNWDKVAQIWAPDATFDVRAGGQLDVETADRRDDKFVREGLVTGRDAILAMMRDFSAQGMVSVHIGHTPDIEVLSETTAKGVWGLEDTVTWASGVPYKSLHGYGHWHDTYEKIQGRWMVKSSKVTRLRIETT